MSIYVSSRCELLDVEKEGLAFGRLNKFHFHFFLKSSRYLLSRFVSLFLFFHCYCSLKS